MLSGALLFTKAYDFNFFIKKRISRILLPFAFWTLVYITFDLFLKYQKGIFPKNIELVKYIFTNLLNGASYHLWYIYMIIGLYLFFPIVSKWLINSSKNEILYFIFIWFLISVFSSNLFLKVESKLYLIYFSGYLGYPILGYFLTNNIHLKSLKPKIILICLFILSILITMICTYIETIKSGKFSETYYSYLSPFVILSSVAIFLIFKDLSFRNKLIVKSVKYISKYSYGIYLVHVLILIVLSKVGLDCNFINPIAGIFLTTFSCLLLSMLVTFFLNKIPYGKYISG
jgi:surface polysaccharide O-acyltransferase-like enzyme